MSLVLLLAACQIEDLNIEIVNEDGSVLFIVHENDAPDPTPLSRFGVVSHYSGARWEVATYEESSLYRMQDGKKLLKPLDELPEINALAVGAIRFGEVPSGFFIQGSSGNHLVALEEGRVYEAYANRGAHRGHISFTIEHGVAVKLPPVTHPLSSP